ncbi:MAG: PAS domain S-box protein [Planctomycetales bacterium]
MTFHGNRINQNGNILQAVLDTTVDAVIVINARGEIQLFNAAAESMFGYAAEEVLGGPINRLMPAPHAEDHDEYVRRYLETGETKIIGIGREVLGLRKDGSTFPADLAVSEVEVEDERFFTGILRDVTEKILLEKEVLRISEQEQRRVGQDLHDGFGQNLGGLTWIAQRLARKLREQDSPDAELAVQLEEGLAESMGQVKSILGGLATVDIKVGGLRSALQQLADKATRRYGVQCDLNSDGDFEVEDATVAHNLYQIAQEAVSNAVRHGDAKQITIALRETESEQVLQIQDEGAGFDVDANETTGLGLRIMNYRAHVIGAELQIESVVPRGTCVRCTLRK